MGRRHAHSRLPPEKTTSGTVTAKGRPRLVRAQVLVLVGYAAAATLLSGCYPVTTLQSPRTQAPRAVELTLAAPRVGFTRSDQGGPPIDRLQYIPAPDVSMRIGVAE